MINATNIQNHAAKMLLNWMLFLCVSSAALFTLHSHALAGDRGDGSFGKDGTKWKRTANFISDPNDGLNLRRHSVAGTKRKGKSIRKAVPAFRPDQLLAAFPAETTDQVIDAVAAEHNLTRMEDISIALLDKRIVKFKVSRSKWTSAQASLAKDTRVASVQPNHLYVLGSTEKAQYALEKLNVDEIHGFADGTDIRIAMLDSGVNEKHPVFGGLEIEQFDATDTPQGVQDGHGTAVASLIAAQQYMTGIVPNPELLSAKTFSYSRRWRKTIGETYHLLQGLDWAVFKQARVFNLSFEGPEDALLRAALLETLRTDAVIIAAAGNKGAKAGPVYPAAYDGVIAVTATDHQNKLYRHANRGAYILVAAPGVNILSASGDDGYSRKSGTSMAAAHVSGIVALMIQASPESTAETIAQRLATTAKDLGKAGRDTSYGYGMINPVKLITQPPLTN